MQDHAGPPDPSEGRLWVHLATISMTSRGEWKQAEQSVRLQIPVSDCREHRFLAPYQNGALGAVFSLRTRLAPGFSFFLFISLLGRFAISVACDKRLSKINSVALASG